MNRFRDGWSVTDGKLAEYTNVRYLGIGPWWIGAGIRWCETRDGSILPSKFSHSGGGTHGLKHYRVLWYFHFTVCKPGKKWMRFSYYNPKREKPPSGPEKQS